MAPASAFGPAPRETANDRLKRRSRVWLWQAVAGAAALHFAAFAFWPAFTAAYTPPSPDEPVMLNLPPLELPEPPAPIQPPALPIIDAEAPQEVTIPSTRLEHNPPEMLPPPPSAAEELRGYEALTPSMVAPRLRNPDEVRRTLERNYPPTLRDAGIGGTVNVHIWLDENGEIVQSRIGRSSGYPSLDDAALEVVEIMRFAPALNRDRTVRVIVNVPIEFKAS